MKFGYQFSNLLGTVYRQGDLLFTPDGNSVISPVGNRITIFDLKSNKSRTLPVESRFNYTALDLSPNGGNLIAINEEGEAYMISLASQRVINTYRFKRKVCAVKHSPDGKYFAVCKENKVFIFKAPGKFSGEYNAFTMERVYHAAHDETTCLEWSTDSRVLAVGSKDMTIRLYPLDRWANFKNYSLTSHTDNIVACFFEENSLDITTIARNGHACVWECTITPEELLPLEYSKKKQKKIDELEEDEVDESKIVERNEKDISASLSEVDLEKDNETKKPDKIFYRRLAIHYLADEPRKSDRDAVLTAAAYNKQTKILVTGFSTGAFFLHEMPELNLIHSLSISDQAISSIAINKTGDWISLGCGGVGQLLVWEWQSETYVMKQQGHSNNMSCLAYSKDGQYLASGGEDGKVKLWNIQSGFCIVTFSEHTNAVTSVAFSGNKKCIVSVSLDGTVRAFDMLRYRNFKTFVTPRPVQLACVDVDSSGEFIAAGGQDVFEIYLWSLKLGKLLEVLSGHEGPVWSLAFNPSPASTALASVSWDKTLRLWDALEKGSAHETIQLPTDGVCVAYNPNGLEVAAGTLDGQISLFDARTGTQITSIEGRNDLGSGKLDTDLVSAKQSLKAKAFTSLCYSADGEYILAGGQSKNVCIYSIKDGINIRKFEITQNRSMDGVDDFINRRKLTEFGNVNLVEERESNEGGNVSIKLPGVKKGDLADRSFKPEVRVFSLQFSPTGQQWAAATTEGMLVYSLNVDNVFDPWELNADVTPSAVLKAIENDDYLNALMMAMKLNEAKLITTAMEKTKPENIEFVIKNLHQKYIERLIIVLTNALDNSTQIEFYLIWCEKLFTAHAEGIDFQKNLPAVLALLKSLNRRYDQLSKICDFNKYTCKILLTTLPESDDESGKGDESDEISEDFNMDNSDEDLSL